MTVSTDFRRILVSALGALLLSTTCVMAAVGPVPVGSAQLR